MTARQSGPIDPAQRLMRPVIPFGPVEALWHMAGVGGVAVPVIGREELVGGYALAAVVDLHGSLADLEVHLASRISPGHRIAVPGVDYMEVEADGAAVRPFAHFVGDGGQRAQLGGLDLAEHLLPAALALLEGMRVVRLEALAHGLLDVSELGERAVPQLGDHPGGRIPHGALCRRLLLRLSDLGRHDCRHVVLAQGLIGVVEHDLALAGMPDDPGLQVVAYGALRDPAPVFVHVHMAAQPGALLHVQRRLEVRLLAEREHAHEQVDLRHLAGRGVDEPLADRGAGPVHLAGDPRLVVDPLGEAVHLHVPGVALAEARVAHRDRVLAPAPVDIFVVQQAQVHAHLGHLPVDIAPVRLGEHALVDVPGREEEPVALLVSEVLHLAPCDVALLRDVAYLADGIHRHVPGLGYLPPRHPLLAKRHYGLRPYLPCHALSSLSVADMAATILWRGGIRRRYGTRGRHDTEPVKQLHRQAIRNP
jgi:hypothetical protein